MLAAVMWQWPSRANTPWQVAVLARDSAWLAAEFAFGFSLICFKVRLTGTKSGFNMENQCRVRQVAKQN
jgi:hypothetical protein